MLSFVIDPEQKEEAGSALLHWILRLFATHGVHLQTGMLILTDTNSDLIPQSRDFE